MTQMMFKPKSAESVEGATPSKLILCLCRDRIFPDTEFSFKLSSFEQSELTLILYLSSGSFKYTFFTPIMCPSHSSAWPLKTKKKKEERK